MKKLIMSIALAAAACAAVSADDVIFLRGGEVLRGKIIYFTDDELRLERVIRGPRGFGSAPRTVPAEAIHAIDFHIEPAALEMLRQPNEFEIDDLRSLWNSMSVRLPWPRSRAGEAGIHFASRLLESEFPSQRREALEIFERIRSKAWDPARRAAAEQGRLRALMGVGRLEEARAEAARFARETDNAALLIEATLMLADARREQLAQLESAHPRWDEDDEVAPERRRLFHETIDLYLAPALFHGSEADGAARGLLGAARLLARDGFHDAARACAEDIARMYPESSSAPDARDILSSNPTQLPDASSSESHRHESTAH